MVDRIIRDSMMQIGEKFVRIAQEADSARGAKGAFDIAERAFRLALLTTPTVVDMNAAFLSQIDCEMKRSQVWVEYNAFCLDHGLYPVTKGVLFDKLKQLGFKFKTKTGEVMVSPPRNKPQILIEAAARFSAD